MTTITLNEYDDEIYTRTICQCTSNDCDVDMSLSITGMGDLEIGFHVEMKSYANHDFDNAFSYAMKDYWWRLKTALKVLFLGHIEQGHSIMLNEKGIKEFRSSVEEGITKIEEHWTKKDKNKEKV